LTIPPHRVSSSALRQGVSMGRSMGWPTSAVVPPMLARPATIGSKDPSGSSNPCRLVRLPGSIPPARPSGAVRSGQARGV
jgi:hypothetical protein